MLPVVYKTVDPVNQLAIYMRKWTDDSFRIVNLNLNELAGLTINASDAPHYRCIQGYTPATPTAEQLAAHPEWSMRHGLGGGLAYRSLYASSRSAPPGDDDMECDEEQPRYRSTKGMDTTAAANAPAPAPAADAEAPAVEVPVETPAPDTSNDEAIAKALADESTDAVPPMVGDKRSLSSANRMVPEEPITNMALTRQSRAPKSAGEAPKITQNIERRVDGVIVVTQLISMALKRGTYPLEADILAMDELAGKVIECAKKASGVSEVKNLSGSYAESIGATSKKPMSVQSKCDVQATLEATANGQVDAGIPVGMEGLF